MHLAMCCASVHSTIAPHSAKVHCTCAHTLHLMLIPLLHLLAKNAIYNAPQLILLYHISRPECILQCNCVPCCAYDHSITPFSQNATSICTVLHSAQKHSALHPLCSYILIKFSESTQCSCTGACGGICNKALQRRVRF